MGLSLRGAAEPAALRDAAHEPAAHGLAVQDMAAAARDAAARLACERAGLGVLVATGEFGIVSANDAALATLARCGLTLARGRLSGEGRPECRRLRALVRRAADLAEPGALLLPFGGAEPDVVAPVVASVVPLPGEPASGLVAIYLTAPARFDADRLSACLQALFGLTPKECAVAGELLRGAAPQDVSRTHRVAIATVRSHLSSILLKTGTVRQSALVRLLAELSRL